MARGTLDRGQAEAIRYLVSSAVAGIAPEAVAVIDAAARRRPRRRRGPRSTPAVPTPGDRAETLRANIQRLLEARVGPGRAIVEVNVDADMDSQTISERVDRPRQPRRDQLRDRGELRERQGGAPGVTVASNLPDGDAGARPATAPARQPTSRERQNFEVSETRRERVILPGQVRRISVAVMVDGIIADRAPTAPRPGRRGRRGDGDAAPAGPVGDRLRRGRAATP